MPCIEMGGNFCLTSRQIDSFSHDHVPYSKDFMGWDHVVFTHSGRSAIITAVRHLGLEGCEVLVPIFSCHSITDAFLSCNCRISYYPINRDYLTVNEAELCRLIDNHKPAILYTCPLFGFDTLSSLRNRYGEIQAQGVKVMEDVTHSLLSDIDSRGADVVVCSLRKWLEIPDGGFIWGLKDFDIDQFYQSHPEDIDIVKNYVEASRLKLEYLTTGNEGLKQVFLPLFYKNNELFNDCGKVCRMSSFSYGILAHADFKRISEQRRENYSYLLSHISNPLVEIIFDSLPEQVVPLYMQVYVHGGMRTPLQQALIKERLYCPVVWHTPSQVLSECCLEDTRFHEDMLSLVIDQRYDLVDMERLVQRINDFNENSEKSC